jgi:hypothetical protein
MKFPHFLVFEEFLMYCYIQIDSPGIWHRFTPDDHRSVGETDRPEGDLFLLSVTAPDGE